jgi:biotin carboxyl carrier protein
VAGAAQRPERRQLPDRRARDTRAGAGAGAARTDTARTDTGRTDDHAAIGRLADELLPALAAKLGATGLGEIEVREGEWRVRVRRPADGINYGRRSTDRPSRSQPGHAGHGHARAAVEGHRAARAVNAPHSTNGNSADSPATARADGGDGGGRRRSDPDPHRAIAKSPAVGIFQPKSGVRAGTRVHAGDRLGVVDMLGVPQDVLAPGEGIVGQSLVEAGDAVEFGQELVVIELLTRAGGSGGAAAGD